MYIAHRTGRVALIRQRTAYALSPARSKFNYTRGEMRH